MTTHHITPNPLRTDCSRDPLADGRYTRDWMKVTCADCLARRPFDPKVDAQAVAWADYRKDYGVPDAAMSHAHKAFIAGWEAARGNLNAGGRLR